MNILARLAPADWPAFLVLAREVYGRVKARHPALPVFLTLQADFFHADPARQRTAIEPLLPFTDLIAVSTYPFQEHSDPRALRGDHFTALAALAPSKRVAVAETAWPAEAVTAPYPVPIPATEEDQRLYVERLLDDAERLRALFVTWFFTRDYDVLWDEEMRLSRMRRCSASGRTPACTRVTAARGRRSPPGGGGWRARASSGFLT